MSALLFFCLSFQMTASNLAVCFAPSLFNLVNVKSTASPSLRRNKKQQGVPDSKEILEPAHECLVFMIKNSKALFTVSTLFFSQSQEKSSLSVWLRIY